MSWNDYLQRVEEAKDFRKKRSRKSGAGLERSLKWILDKGPQKKGGYPKKRRPNFRRKKFNDISAPPGAPGGLEEVERESFTIHDELQPDIWDEDKLNEEVENRLLEIAADFIERLNVLVDVEDVRLTGSLANYNWSMYSDIDLHLLVDFSKINKDTGLVKAFFDEARMRWNDHHRIMIHGFEVEIYVENVDEEHKSSGIYSLGADSWSAEENGGTAWIVKPEPQQTSIDFDTAEKKAQDYKDRTDCIAQMIYEETRVRKRLFGILFARKRRFVICEKWGLNQKTPSFRRRTLRLRFYDETRCLGASTT